MNETKTFVAAMMACALSLGAMSVVAAPSPYATRVVACHTDETNESFNVSANVIGRPTTYMTGPWGGVVSPVNSAWQAGELFTLDSFWEDAFMTVEFDHQVEDDPLNPYGIDFIVFGNAFVFTEGMDYYYDGANPFDFRFGSGADPEPGLVEVSQDGETWFSYTNGPYADTMPTLGHVIDTNNPSASLFDGNLWWGGETDPTVPADPSLKYEDFTGLSLGEACLRYGKSAGGNGFDISGFDLPVNGRGLKWIKYVRVSPMPTGELDAEGFPVYTTPEVDAFCDVAPASRYECWARSQYGWDTYYADGGQGRVAENGRSNHENFVLGLDVAESSALTFSITGFSMDDSRLWFSFDSLRPYSDALNVRGKASLRQGQWGAGVPATFGSSVRVGDVFRNSYYIDRESTDCRFFSIEVPDE